MPDPPTVPLLALVISPVQVAAILLPILLVQDALMLLVGSKLVWDGLSALR